MPETELLTLTDFLLARIAEDEAEVQRLVDRYPFEADQGGWYGNADDIDIRLGLGRAVAECEAKRRIVDWAAPMVSGLRHENEDGRDLLTLLALPYADHPDYREEWKP